ncbi:MAG: energy transducer TonB [Calditrichaeota bacterium]|nr:energy transducer TonB [Calditrichota bacterium]
MGLRQDSFTLALVVSLIAHLLFLSLWGATRQLHLPAIVRPRTAAEAKEQEKRLEFELVETPSNARNELPSARTHLLSDKSTRARDLYPAKDKPVGDAYSEGQSPYRTFSGGLSSPAGPESRPQPQPQAASESSRPAAAERPLEPGVAVAEEASERRQRARFSPEVLAAHPGGSSRAGLFGSDDATYRQVTFSAEELGGVTLNTYAWDFAPYVLEMKRKIRQNIYPPPAFTRLGIISGETVLRFRVLPDGQMTNLEVLGYTGHPSLKETSVVAVMNAAPFKPLPKSFPEEYLELTWTFIYSVTRQ